jgi:hypothetical protein
MERYPSGSRGRFAKSLGGSNLPRGFESLSLRHIYSMFELVWNTPWRGVRVVEGNSLENCRTGNGTVGSNPTLSANYYLCSGECQCFYAHRAGLQEDLSCRLKASAGGHDVVNQEDRLPLDHIWFADIKCAA